MGYGLHNKHEFGSFKDGFDKAASECKIVMQKCEALGEKPDKEVAILLDEGIKRLKAMYAAISASFEELRKTVNQKEKEMLDAVGAALDQRIKCRNQWESLDEKLKKQREECKNTIEKGCVSGCEDYEEMKKKTAELIEIKAVFEELLKMKELSVGEYKAPTLEKAINAVKELKITEAMLKDESKTKFKDSLILKTDEHKNILSKWISESNNNNKTIEFTLLYRSTRDGRYEDSFHSKCDNRGPTVTIIQSTSGHIFGGYTELSWGTDTGYRYDANAFIYSITHETKHSKQKNTNYSICDSSTYCATFGGGHDICLGYSRTVSHSFCYSNGDHTYELPANVDSQTYLAGSCNFTATEIEVYSVKEI